MFRIGLFAQVCRVSVVTLRYYDEIVRLRDTVRGFRMILDGEVDHIPEQLFYMAGPIEDVLGRYEQELQTA